MQTMTMLGLGAISLWGVAGAMGVWARLLDNQIRAHQLNLDVVAELERRKPKYTSDNPEEPNFDILDDAGEVIALSDLEPAEFAEPAAGEMRQAA